MRSSTPALVALFCSLLWPLAARAQEEAPVPIQDLDRNPSKKAVKAKAPAAEEPAAEEEESSAPAKKKGKQAAADDEEPAEEDTGAEPGSSNPGRRSPRGNDAETPAVADVPPHPVQLGNMFGPELPPGHNPNRPLPRPLIVASATDEDLLAQWTRWRKSTAALDLKDAQEAQNTLFKMKEDLAISDLDSFATGFIRVSLNRANANDKPGAVSAALSAVQLAPNLPYAHTALATAYFYADPTDVGRYLGEARAAMGSLVRDPRYLRAAVADLGSGALFALAATAAAVSLAFFLRKSRYFFHDFHHLFPKSSARWQSVATAAILLLAPAVLHLGVVPILLTLLAAVTLYLGLAERIVAAALIAMLGAMPLLAGLLAEQTSFAGTVAEDVYRLERGGVAASSAMQRTLKRQAEDKAGFPELFALARYELRRGKLDAAVEHFKLAATKRGNEARLLTNLGNALLQKGDTDGALEIYQSASEAGPSLAAPLFNMSKLHSRRAAALPDDAVGLELEKAHNALTKAQTLDQSLFSRDDDLLKSEPNANRLLLSPGLTSSEIAALASTTDASEKVTAQLSRTLLGANPSAAGFAYPLVLGILLVVAGQLAPRLNVSKACDKCGRSVCRRCDPEIGLGSNMCGQCVNVYARKGVVPAPLKVRKQLEVSRYQTRMGRISYVLGLIYSGAGHIFSGLPVRGAIYAFLFSFALFHAFFRQGVVRSPFGAMPGMWRLAPVALLFLSVYLLSLRGLYKRQTE